MQFTKIGIKVILIYKLIFLISNIYASFPDLWCQIS